MYMSGTLFPVLLSFLPLLPEFVWTVYADVIARFSGTDRFSVFNFYPMIAMGLRCVRFAHTDFPLKCKVDVNDNCNFMIVFSGFL